MSSAECCFGAAFKDFVLVAADKSQIFSIILPLCQMPTVHPVVFVDHVHFIFHA